MSGSDVIISIIIGIVTGIVSGVISGLIVSKHYIKKDEKAKYKLNLNVLRKQMSNMKKILSSKENDLAKEFFTLSAYRMNLTAAMTYCSTNKLKNDAKILAKLDEKFLGIENNVARHEGLVGDVGEIYKNDLDLLIINITSLLYKI
jgi:uncharacterized protein YneF (UPF0154 family)